MKPMLHLLRSLTARCLLFGGLLFAGSAFAAIVPQYTYVDPYGVSKTALHTTQYINPAATIDVAAVAGIDRKLEISIVDAIGNVVEQAVSPVITAVDRINIGGSDYYGFFVTINAPAVDGDYTLRARILAYDNSQVAMENYPVVIDRTPPSTVGDFGYDAWRPDMLYPLPDDSVISPGHAQRMWMQGLSDVGSGIDQTNARFHSIYLEGPNVGALAYDVPAVVDLAQGTVHIGTGDEFSVNSGLQFPAVAARILARFVVFDRAGNVASFDKPIHWFGVCDTSNIELFAVFDPDDTNNLVPASPFVGYVPYVPGMTVKTNPVRMLLRIPKSNWWQFATYGVSIRRLFPANPGWPKNAADFVDANFVYIPIDFAYIPPGEDLNPDYRITAPTWYTCRPETLIKPNLILDPNAGQSPQFNRVELVFQNLGTVPNLVGTTKYNVVDTVTSLTFHVDARPYDQTVNTLAMGGCTIATGDLSCTATPNRVMGDEPDGMELWHEWIRVYSAADPMLASNVIAPRIIFDTNRPSVTSATITPDGTRADLVMTEHRTNDWWSYIIMKSARLEAENAAGAITTVAATNLLTTDAVLTWTARVNLTTLPSDVYTLRFYATDNFGNDSDPFEIADYTIDRTPPDVTIKTTLGTPLQGATISSLNQVRATVTDTIDSDPTVTSVKMTGGPENLNVNLGFYLQGSDYRLEFPAMLPSLGTGDYRITLTAQDDFGNVRVTTADFDYKPPSFDLVAENGQSILLPLIDRATRMPNGNWPLTTEPAFMTDAGGMPVVGLANLTITLSGDAQGAVVVGGITLNPNQSIVYPNYDFTANQSALKIPLHVSNPAGVTPGRFGTLVVQIDRPDTPVLIEDIDVWSPIDSVTVTQGKPAFAKRVEVSSIRLVNGGEQRCDTLVSMIPGDSYRNVRFGEDVAICAVEWVNLPGDLEAMRLDRSKVSGVIQSYDASVDMSYQPGLLIKQAGEFTFFPVGPVTSHTVDLYDPDPPVITVGSSSDYTAQRDWLPAGKFPTGLGEFVAGYVNGRADFPGLDMIITQQPSGSVVLDQSYSSSFARGALQTNIGAIEGEQSFTAQVRYTNYPAISTSADITFVALPKKPILQLARPSDPNNMVSTVVEGRFGLSNKGQFTFDQGVLGTWLIEIYKQQAVAGGSSDRVKLAQGTTQIGADGAFAIDLGILDPGVYGIVAVATYQAGTAQIDGTVESLPTVIKVFNGDAVSFSLTTNTPTGRNPMTATVKMMVDEPKRAADVGSIAWERSLDGINFDPVVLDPRYTRAFGYGERLLNAGTYWYRATSTNRFSGATYTADPILVHIYETPKFSLSGYNYTLSNLPVQWSVVPEDPARPTVYKWSVRPGSYKAEPIELMGPLQTFDASVNGSWYITVHARYADAPDVPGSWRKVSALLKVAAPYMSRPRIVGPVYVETGGTYEFRSQVFAITQGNADPNIRVVGLWELPDGTTLNADTINYTVQPGDAEIKYTAWVQGFRLDTEQTTTLKLRTWDYEFPEFRLYKRLIREYDPVQYSYSVVPTRTNMGAEKPSYDWTFTPGTTIDVRSPTSVTVSASAIGDYDVAVKAADTRGNQSVLNDQFNVAEPPPLSATLSAIVSDAWNRAPARTTVRWYAAGLLSKERVNSVNINLNGVPVSDRLLSSYSFDIDAVGDHTLDVDLSTTYGRSANYSTQVSLVAGELPTCSITTTGDGVSSLRAQAACQVTMGRILSYHWWVTYADTGETRDLGLRSSMITFLASELSRGISQIKLVAINDKGQEALPAIWNQ